MNQKIKSDNMSINLLKETLEFLKKNNKSEEDICFIQTYKGSMAWSRFKILAATIDFHPGYGCNEIELSLVIVGDNWWIERREYDGSEWWEFKELPEKKAKILLTRKKNLLCGQCYKDVEDE